MGVTCATVDDTAVAVVDEQLEGSAETEALVEQELLVEEISIDGMCGVY